MRRNWREEREEGRFDNKREREKEVLKGEDRKKREEK